MTMLYTDPFDMIHISLLKAVLVSRVMLKFHKITAGVNGVHYYMERDVYQEANCVRELIECVSIICCFVPGTD